MSNCFLVRLLELLAPQPTFNNYESQYPKGHAYKVLSKLAQNFQRKCRKCEDRVKAQMNLARGMGVGGLKSVCKKDNRCREMHQQVILNKHSL